MNDPKQETSAAHIIAHDVMIVVDPAMGHHLLRLLTDDLRRSAGASREWLSEWVALACYVHDALPEELRVTVPSVAQIRGDHGPRVVA